MNEALIDNNNPELNSNPQGFRSCNSCQTQYIQFRGIRPDDSNGREPLQNPERGFRLEHIMKASDLSNPYFGINYTHKLPAEINGDENYYVEKPKITQLYFYLTEYLKTNIPEQAFRNMQSVLDDVKKTGYKVILLFAYRYDETCQYETYDDIKRHLKQLKSFLQKNESVIYAFQAGFLGLWGEWHRSGLDNLPYYKKMVIRDLLQTLPAGRKMQVRETDYKTDAAGFIRRTQNGPVQYYPLETGEYNRIGFQNAYFVLDQGPNSKFDYRWPDYDFLMVQREALSTVVDGEMPYDGTGAYTFNLIAHGSLGGWQAANRMRTHAHSSFSIVHNFRTNISAWKSQLLSADQFRKNNVVVTDDYFLNQQDKEIPKTAYEYIRDHLGYRFQLREAYIPAQVNPGDSVQFTFQLKNFGFAPLINKRPVYLVLIDEQNRVIEYLTNADPRKWLPANTTSDHNYTLTHAIHFNNSIAPGKYKVGLWLPDDAADLKYDPGYAIRLANGNMEWWQDAGNQYLINIIGSFQVN